MNKFRRKEIDKIIEKIIEIKELVQTVYEEEEEYKDNIPKNMQSSERYETADAAVSSLDDALNSLEDTIDYLTSAQYGE